MRLPVILCALLLGLAGCGGTQDRNRPQAAGTAQAEPSLARGSRAPGEVVLRGEASPRTHGPIELDGRYTVRFQQYAPEDPRMDFSGQTTFVATLERSAGRPAVRLFRAARATGHKTVTLHGRYLVDVSFGDFPYVLRLSPVRQ
ncbi:MAG TPA: hypothetical protein VGO71_21355 [Baekduia sp.]|nr:hypothetical protein [Baekduia sp.]